MTNLIEERRKQVMANLDWRAENASNTARCLSLAVVGVVWGILVMDVGSGLTSRDWQHSAFLVSGGLAILSLLADWLQAIGGYCSASRDFNRVFSANHNPESEDAHEYGFWYRTTEWGFVAKQICAPLSAMILFVALLPSILSD